MPSLSDRTWATSPRGARCGGVRSLFVVVASLLLTGSSLFAGSAATLAPADTRFDSANLSETPHFQKHVVPLLGRLGCNGRACHGSFQGQGGLRLSLFGYDFAEDHRALTADATSAPEPRINAKEVAESLILLKPTMEVEHEGGMRFAPDSWEYHLLRRWIEAGAQPVTEQLNLARLEVEPKEVLFDADSSPQSLRVTATWEDGTREDVTPLCRFRTNDDSVATVDEDGLVTSTGSGDTHVIAFYDNGVAAVPVLRPYPSETDLAGAEAAGEPSHPIDRLVETKLRKLNIAPSPPCDDATFLRRVSIDLTGTLPAPSEVRAFVADRAPDKRTQKVDDLLQRSSYAAWWANKLCDFTGCNPRGQAELGQETAAQWYRWIYQRLRENMPYDEIVRRIMLATSRQPDEPYDAYAERMSQLYRDETGAEFASQDSMPHYWTRRSMQNPEEAAQAVAHNFLGIRLQCAQCHKHPFAPWSQEDFQQFSRFFENISYGVRPEDQDQYRQLARQVGLNVRGDDGAAVNAEAFRKAQRGATIPWRELYIANRDEPASLQLLRSQTISLEDDTDPRVPIVDWMQRRDNPWFATAIVNRVWASYFHVGIIDPPDDLNPANPPSNPALLDWLVENFVENEYDLQWLHRTIVTSETYQRSWIPNGSNAGDRSNFSRAIPRRMPAEVVYDSVKQALAANEKADQVRTDLSRRAIGYLSMRLAGTYAMQVFGKPDRDVNCDCERVNSPTLLQSIFLQNDPLLTQRLADSEWLEQVAAKAQTETPPTAEALVTDAWLRTLSRLPSAEEKRRAVEHLAAAESLGEGLRDLMWALLNTKEFILIQ